ncbi:phosphate uptake regulator PhoU [Candidatus Woesearchaeota archaeon]|nr:phosphate uptake regulator PhoU [Candidatus Woesearchaeota archaeon]
MRRKLVQLGNSTLFLSMPRDWVQENGLSKGDEVEVSQDQDKVLVWPDCKLKKDTLMVDVTRFKDMLPRLLYSIYRSGYDEVELRSEDQQLIGKIKTVMWKETVGYELMEQTGTMCRIVNVSGKVDDFNNLLRRLFLITLTISEEALNAIKKGLDMENVIYLEKESNRLNSMLVRSINKYGSNGFRKIGPLYYIIQELERIADQYKYMAQYMAGKNLQDKQSMVRIFDKTNLFFRSIYELFYTFNPSKIEEIKKRKNEIVNSILNEMNRPQQHPVILSSLLSVTTRSYDMVSSIIILRMDPDSTLQ